METAETDAAQTPTEDMINKLIDDFQLYQDPYLKAVITECHGRTPLHVAVAEKHEDVVNCFVDFQGRLLYQTTNYSKVNVFFGLEINRVVVSSYTVTVVFQRRNSRP